MGGWGHEQFHGGPNPFAQGYRHEFHPAVRMHEEFVIPIVPPLVRVHEHIRHEEVVVAIAPPVYFAPIPNHYAMAYSNQPQYREDYVEVVHHRRHEEEHLSRREEHLERRIERAEEHGHFGKAEFLAEKMERFDNHHHHGEHRVEVMAVEQQVHYAQMAERNGLPIPPMQEMVNTAEQQFHREQLAAQQQYAHAQQTLQPSGRPQPHQTLQSEAANLQPLEISGFPPASAAILLNDRTRAAVLEKLEEQPGMGNTPVMGDLTGKWVADTPEKARAQESLKELILEMDKVGTDAEKRALLENYASMHKGTHTFTEMLSKGVSSIEENGHVLNDKEMTQRGYVKNAESGVWVSPQSHGLPQVASVKEDGHVLTPDEMQGKGYTKDALTGYWNQPEKNAQSPQQSPHNMHEQSATQHHIGDHDMAINKATKASIEAEKAQEAKEEVKNPALRHNLLAELSKAMDFGKERNAIHSDQDILDKLNEKHIGHEDWGVSEKLTDQKLIILANEMNGKDARFDAMLKNDGITRETTGKYAVTDHHANDVAHHGTSHGAQQQQQAVASR